MSDDDPDMLGGDGLFEEPQTPPADLIGEMGDGSPVDRLTRQLHENLQFLQRQQRQIRNRQANIDQAKAALRADRAALAERLQLLDRQQSELHHEREVMQATAAEIAAQQQAQQAMLHERQTQLDQFQAELERAAGQIARDAGEVESRRTEFEAQQRAVQQAQDQRQRSFEENCREQEQARLELEAALKRFQLDRDDLEQRRAALEQIQIQNAAGRDALNRTATELAAREAAAVTCASVNAQERAELERVRAELAEFAAALGEREAELASQAEALQGAEQQVEKERQRLAALEMELIERETQNLPEPPRPETPLETELPAPQPILQELKLVLMWGDGQRRDFQMSGAVLVIGREQACDITIKLSTVSRVHCILERMGGGVRLRDMGSTNGTLRNGERVTRCVLEAGDVVNAGGVPFTLVVGGYPGEIPEEPGRLATQEAARRVVQG